MIRLLMLTIIVMASALTSGCAAYAGARTYTSGPQGQNHWGKSWNSAVYVPTISPLGVKEVPGAVPIWQPMGTGRTIFKAGGKATMNIKYDVHHANAYYYNRPARTAGYYVKVGKKEQGILVRY